MPVVPIDHDIEGCSDGGHDHGFVKGHGHVPAPIIAPIGGGGEDKLTLD